MQRNLRGEGVCASWGQLHESLYLQARHNMSEPVANSWNMSSFKMNIVM